MPASKLSPLVVGWAQQCSSSPQCQWWSSSPPLFFCLSLSPAKFGSTQHFNRMNMMESEAKEEFIKEFADYYGYPNSSNHIDHIRSTQFTRLAGNVYLDHAGATLYSESQMEAIFKDLTTSLHGNPHSQSNSSAITSDIVADMRQQVLNMCNASPREYKCIFTSGATAALKLVGEAFPWSHQSCFMYTIENHNSVLGIREYPSIIDN